MRLVSPIDLGPFAIVACLTAIVVVVIIIFRRRRS